SRRASTPIWSAPRRRRAAGPSRRDRGRPPPVGRRNRGARRPKEPALPGAAGLRPRRRRPGRGPGRQPRRGSAARRRRRPRARPSADGRVVRAALESLRRPGLPASARVAPALAADLRGILAERPLRDGVTVRGPYTLIVQRRRALFSSWYEFFPRSEGAHFDP